jgi:hypothetical protein
MLRNYAKSYLRPKTVFATPKPLKKVTSLLLCTKSLTIFLSNYFKSVVLTLTIIFFFGNRKNLIPSRNNRFFSWPPCPIHLLDTPSVLSYG